MTMPQIKIMVEMLDYNFIFMALDNIQTANKYVAAHPNDPDIKMPKFEQQHPDMFRWHVPVLVPETIGITGNLIHHDL